MYYGPVESAKQWLLAALVVVTASFVGAWWLKERGRADRTGEPGGARARPTPLHVGIGVLTDFLDTLGIGSFATTTALFRFTRAVDDRVIPGTLNVGHALPTVAQALIYVSIVEVETTTLVPMIAAAVLGAGLGAGFVATWSRRRVRLGMGMALLAAGTILASSLLGVLPVGGEARALDGARLAAGVAGNFVLGVLMTVGIGLYAPCMILVSLLGMDPKAAFPVMMGSCAFLMPLAGMSFIRARGYDLKASLGLTLGGVPAVLAAAFIVTSLPLGAVRWLVLGVVMYTAFMLLRAARSEETQAP